MSIRSSMYRVIFVLTTLPFLLFSLFITQLYANRLDKILDDSLHVVANTQASEMAKFCERQRDYLSSLGSMDIAHAAAQGTLTQKMQQYLDNMLFARVNTMEELDSLAILDRDFLVVGCSEAHQRFAMQGIEKLAACVAEQPFYISDILTTPAGERSLVAISRMESEGAFLGYILAEINMDFYKTLRENLQLWNEGTFYLLDGNQQIISAGTPEEERGAFITAPEERADYFAEYNAQNFEEAPQGSFRYNIRGMEYTTYYSDVQYTNWQLLLSVNISSYQSQRTIYFVLTAFVALLCGVLGIWISRFASRRIIQPINRISDTLKAVQKKQDYTLRAPVQRKDELGQMAGAINELLRFIETEDLYKTQQQRLLQEKAEQDALTKVLNKEKINECLKEAIDRHSAQRTALAVLFVDVDNFKDFNTQYGHSTGDQVLLFVASSLTQATSGTVGRVGGDEFLVIVEESGPLRSLAACLEQVREMTRNRFVVRGSGTRLSIGCSIGAVRIDFSREETGNLSVAQVMEIADAAMYRAKNGGKQGHVILEL